MTKKAVKKEKTSKIKGNTVTVSQINADKITQVSFPSFSSEFTLKLSLKLISSSPKNIGQLKQLTPISHLTQKLSTTFIVMRSRLDIDNVS